MFKLMDKKIIAILRKLFLFNWPYVIVLLCCYYSILYAVLAGDDITSFDVRPECNLTVSDVPSRQHKPYGH